MAKSIVHSAFVLTLASIVTKVLGFAYRIYMSNTIGAEGMGLYQLIMPVYFLCWTITSSGFSTAVSKLTAQENAKKQHGNIGRILKQSIFFTATIGIIIGVVLFVGADYIATHIIKDARTMLSLKLLSVCFPMMSAASCIRGYFHGIQENTVPAISQVFEQCVRMAVVYFLSSFALSKGIEYACAVAVAGICVGEILSFVLVMVSYLHFKRRSGYVNRPKWSASQANTYLLAMAIPLTANRIVTSLLSATENVLIPQKLQAFGANASQAMSQYGTLTGMVMPLIHFPSALLSALAVTLIPVVSEATALKNRNRITSTISRSFLFTTVVGIGASAAFLIFPQEVGFAIFKQKEVGEMLLKISILCPFLYMQVIMSGMLNGLGEQLFIFKINLISSVINIAATALFVPTYGIDAYLLTWFLSILLTCFLCTSKVCKSVRLHFSIRNWVYKPIISAIAAGLIARLMALRYVFPTVPLLPGVLFSIGFMMGLYVLFLIALRAVSKEDMQMITQRIRGTS